MNENEIFSVKLKHGQYTRNSFCKLKLNYCWIYCKWKETTDEKEATVEEIVYKHLIVETFSGKSFSNRNMKKNAKRKLCQSQTWKWNYWLIDRQKQSLKIAVAHHDRNNVPTIIFCECQKKLLSNQLWMKIFAWKSFCQTETWNRN